MCGIIGFRQLCGEQPHPEFMGFLEALLVESQIRGKHATGVAWAHAGKIRCVKAPVDAETFITDSSEGGWQEFRAANPAAAILHTRYSTSGDWQTNANNQPLKTNQLAVVHNGLVSMATQEEFESAYGVATKTANDSEILLRTVLEFYNESPESGPDTASITKALAAALGEIHEVHPPIFACGLLDAQGNVVAVRDHIRPLWFFYIKPWGVLGFASTQDIIKRALSRVRLRKHPEIAVWEATPYKVYPLGPRIDKDAVQLQFSYPTEFRFSRPQLVDLKQVNTWKRGYLAEPVPASSWDVSYTDMRQAFKDYYVAIVSTWEVDPNYPLLSYCFQRYELSKEQEYWWCWLYGVFYHPGTLFWFAQEFPEFEKVDVGRLERWHTTNWRRLRYNTDRKYEKGHLVEMFLSYKELIGDQSQEQFFSGLLQSNDPVRNFHRVWRELLKLRRFGRYAVYIYTEALARCMGMPIQADTAFLKEAKSSRNGLCYALSRKDWVDAPVSSIDFSVLEAETSKLMRELEQENPGLRVDYWLMESVMCAFKGHFRTTKGRYIPFYVDRMLEEIHQLELLEPEATKGIAWEVLHQFRWATFPPEFLGELGGWDGIRKHLQFQFRDTGSMFNMGLMQKRGIVNGQAREANPK